MKTKLFPSFILMLFIITNISSLHAQDISINLSIRWSEKPYLFNTDSIVQYPELVVSYTNNSNKKLYFKKSSDNPNGYVGFYHEYLSPYYSSQKFSYYNALRKDKTNMPNKDDKFIVYLYTADFYSYSKWQVEFKDYSREIDLDLETDYVNHYLDVVNECIYREILGYNNPDWGNLLFTQSDISKDSIWENKHNMFMFLNPHETKDDVYNLTCFYILKGTYTFIIDNECFKNGVPVEFVPGKITTTPLPKKIKRFKLYSGEFSSNSVTVTFE